MNITKRKAKKQKQKRENMQECPVCAKATVHSVFIDGDAMIMVCVKCGNQLIFRL